MIETTSLPAAGKHRTTICMPAPCQGEAGGFGQADNLGRKDQLDIVALRFGNELGQRLDRGRVRVDGQRQDREEGAT